VSENPNQENIEEALEEDQVTLDSEQEATAEQDTAESEQIAKLTEELAEAKEQALRSVAEAQNARRRAEQDVEKAHKFALEKFVGSLLPVVDNLERAIEAAAADGAEPQVLNEGVELTLKTFVDALKGHKVEQVAPEGEPFDPQLHQAISAVESPEAEPNTVLNVVQKGYTLNGRLVRPAMVVVSKASS
jgi:molecular chaperone GrpE